MPARPTGIKFRYEANVDAATMVERIQSLNRDKKPKQNLPYVGIEIEFFSEYSKQTIYEITARYSLHRICKFKSDSSIDEFPEGRTPIEIVCLLPQKYWKRYLKVIIHCLKRCKAEVNNTCGIHVHLDHRMCTGRNPAATYLSLQRMQNFLFSLTKPSANRRNNRYCPYENEVNFYRKFTSTNRYSAINTDALRKFETIEVRLFHSTIDLDEIQTYINCLLFGVKRCDSAISKHNENVAWEWKLQTMLDDAGLPSSAKEELRKKFAIVDHPPVGE